MQNNDQTSISSRFLLSHTKLNIWEVYAHLVLQYINPDIYANLQYQDKPDLQDTDSDLGVEVTQAIARENIEAEALYAKLLNEREKKTQKRHIERIEMLGAEVFDWGLFGPKGTNDFNLIMTAFEDKTSKLNSGNYKHFNHNHLFIRSDILADQTMLEKALSEFLCRKTNEKQFERVVVSVPHHNYVFDLLNKYYDDFFFPTDIQFEIATRAREIVEFAES